MTIPLDPKSIDEEKATVDVEGVCPFCGLYWAAGHAVTNRSDSDPFVMHEEPYCPEFGADEGPDVFLRKIREHAEAQSKGL